MEFFKCPGCHRVLEDRGDSPVVICPDCGAVIPSRGYGEQAEERGAREE